MKQFGVLFLIGVATTHAQSIDPKAVDAIIQQALKEWQVPGVAVAIVRDDKAATCPNDRALISMSMFKQGAWKTKKV